MPLKTWIQPLPDPDIKQINPRGHGYQTIIESALRLGSSSITDNMITFNGISALNFKFKRYSL